MVFSTGRKYIFVAGLHRMLLPGGAYAELAVVHIRLRELVKSFLIRLGMH